MPKRVWMTSSQLRAGIGPLVTLLLQGHEVVLTQQGAPVGVIRGWTKADGPPPGPPVEPPAKGKPKAQPETGGRTWAADDEFPTSRLKPTFSTPPE